MVADPGAIGGSGSEEFHVLADSGEDAIAFSDGDRYAANLEMAVALPPATPRAAPATALAEVATPDARTIDEVTQPLKLPADRLVKTLLVDGSEGGVVALLVRGDHELNAVKAQKLPGVANPLRMASNDSHRLGYRRRGRVPRAGGLQGQGVRRSLRWWRWRTSSAAPTRRMRISPA